MGIEQPELALRTDDFEGDVGITEATDNEGPHEEVGGSAHNADRLDRKAMPPTKVSPKLGQLARSNPSDPSKSPWYLSKLPLASLTLSTMIEAACSFQKLKQ